MRILMISPYLPWPLYGGSGIRMYNILKNLSQLGHQIVLLAGHENASKSPPEELTSICEAVHVYQLPARNKFSRLLQSLFSLQPYPASKFQSTSLHNTLHPLLRSGNFDLIWVNFELMAYTLPNKLVSEIPVILDEHESQQLVWRDYLQHGAWWQRIFSLINLAKLRRSWRKTAPSLGAVACVSDKEAALMRNRAPTHVKVWTVPNGVDLEFYPYTPPSQDKANNIMLCGNMSVRRNIDAAIWFVHQIFPAVKELVEDAEFWIVGSRPTPEVWDLEDIAGIHVTGTVDDVRPYYAKAKVVVAPYRFGAGTKLKVLEALACGTPIVSTPLGCRGIDVVHNEHLLVADNETDFSNFIIELLHNPQKAKALAEAGRMVVKEKYVWRVIVGKLESKLYNLISESEM